MQNASPIRRFLSDTSGAVTVDWVFLTAIVVGVALGVVLIMQSVTVELADRIAHVLGSHIHPGGGP